MRHSRGSSGLRFSHSDVARARGQAARFLIIRPLAWALSGGRMKPKEDHRPLDRLKAGELPHETKAAPYRAIPSPPSSRGPCDDLLPEGYSLRRGGSVFQSVPVALRSAASGAVLNAPHLDV